MRIFAIVVSMSITVIAVALLIVGLQQMTRVIRGGKPAHGRKDNPRARTVNMLKETFGHTRMLQWQWIGIMHWLVFAGFIFLSSAVLTAYFQVFDANNALPIIGHFFLFEWFTEALSWLTVIGIVYLIFVRQRNHPRDQKRNSRFFGSSFWQAYFVEAIILGEAAAGIFIRAAEFHLHDGTKFHFPLTWFIANGYGDISDHTAETIIYAVATAKILMATVWVIVIARNITMGVAWHRFLAWFNIWFKRESDGSTALGALQPIMVKGKPLDLENVEDLEEEDFNSLGVGQVEDFTWKNLLDFSTCTECGRCQSQCPAWNTEKPLSPKLLVMGLREHAYAKMPHLGAEEGTLTEEQTQELERPLIGTEDMFGVIDPDVLWSCTNCGACVQQCPVDIEHVDHIEDMRRYQVLVESNFPSELNNIFKGLERKGNPWNMDPKNRMDWTKGLDFEVKQVGRDIEDLDEVEWLFWVGCAGAYEDRAKKTTQAVAELLNTAGVSFGVLGNGETCNGDPARRAGNEIVFQQLAMENAETLKETKAKKVVSTCAHCFNTLKNEYKEFGVELEVVHHTQLLNRLVREGKLTPVAETETKVADKTITYHDPCFLGRHNQVYEPPRELLEAIPGASFKEMPRNAERSFCCGAGGARMWMEETIGTRINTNRTEEAVATGADQIAVGCPFCRIMLSDGLTLQQSEGKAREEVEVLDVAQMLLASVRRGTKTVEADAADEAGVVAEAETATAAAATPESKDSTPPPSDEVAGGSEATEGAPQAEPNEEDQASPDPVSDTDEAAAAAAADAESADDASESASNDGSAEESSDDDTDVAAESSTEVDDAVSDQDDASQSSDSNQADAAESQSEKTETDDVVPVDEGSTPDSVSEDSAELQNASPTAEEVSAGADKASAPEQLSFDDADDDDATSKTDADTEKNEAADKETPDDKD